MLTNDIVSFEKLGPECCLLQLWLGLTVLTEVSTLTPIESTNPQEEQSKIIVWKSQSGGHCTGRDITLILISLSGLWFSLGAGISNSIVPSVVALKIKNTCSYKILTQSKPVVSISKLHMLRLDCTSLQSHQSICSLPTCIYGSCRFFKCENMCPIHTTQTLQPLPEVKKLILCSTQLSMKFSLLINMKMPTAFSYLLTEKFSCSTRNFLAQLCLTRKNLSMLVIWDLLAE